VPPEQRLRRTEPERPIFVDNKSGRWPCWPRQEQATKTAVK
jgi:hypothetical protein